MSCICSRTYSLQHLRLAFHNIACLQIASRISPQMKFGPPNRPFLQVPVMSLAQKVIVSEPGDEPQLAGRTEQGAELYKAILEDTGQSQTRTCSWFTHGESAMHATHGTVLCFMCIHLHILFADTDVVICRMICCTTIMRLHQGSGYPAWSAPQEHCACGCGSTGVPAAGGENSWEFKKSPLNKEKVFDMGHIWTFHMHQHIVDLSTFNMQILKQFDITHYLNGQPLQSMIKDRWAVLCRDPCVVLLGPIFLQHSLH